MLPPWIANVHAVATLMMAGVIWFVQVVHYPLFSRISGRGFAGYEREHMRRTTALVVPLMLCEAACAAALVAMPPRGAIGPAMAGLALLMLIWLVTWRVQVPCHRRLAAGYDANVAGRLVRSNWVRTWAWTARAGIAMTLVGLH